MGREPQLTREQGYWRGCFEAMASDCEVLMEVDGEPLAADLLRIVSGEARRIERKFSRYRRDNIVHLINTSNGMPLEVDNETAKLIDYAALCHGLSEGLFDVTSGVLRRVWTFDGSDRVPAPEVVEQALEYVGWDKVTWRRPELTLPSGMEIDLGGIGKEYAVDRAARLVGEKADVNVVVNFGGDLFITGPRRGGGVWNIGVQDPCPNGPGLLAQLNIRKGGVATSGDARRFLIKDSKRYSHILDPRTGWPVEDAPHSVTVVAATCMEAGMLATIAMLHGREARKFLEAQGVPFLIF